ncbi:MAG: hypothetical protein HN576_14835 [Bacteriovoracaceae bacterium]|jgi:hypothetical protein|nr:hypothetical protein [Bacteriovoracaceae bacterium]
MKLYLGLILLIFCQLAHSKTCNKKVSFKPGSPIKSNVYHCPDGSVSYSQIKSTFVPNRAGLFLRYATGSQSVPIGRNESYCGATAAANVHNAYCKKYFINPKTIANRYFDDINPGVRYDTLVRGLNDLFQNQGRDCVDGYWYRTNPKDDLHFINILYRQLNSKKGYWKNPKTKKTISPAIVLINRTPKTTSLHFVTVVGIEGYTPSAPNSRNSKTCKITINEWGNQSKITCSSFAKLASQVDSPRLLRWMDDYYVFIYR